MIEEPLFRDNILSNIYNNFKFYFGYNDFFMYVIAVAILNLLMVLIVHYCFAKKKYQLLPSEHYCFNRNNRSDVIALAVLILSVVLYSVNVLTFNGTIFGSYNMMNIDNLNSMQRGVKPVFDSIRFCPLQSIDHNVIYAISHNFELFVCWVIFKQLLSVVLLYKFFDFVPVNKRLIMIAVINFMPAVFWVNSMIFGEQNSLIFVLLSFWCLRWYNGRHKLRDLIAFAIFMNMAFYTKEINIFVYMGFFTFLVLRLIVTEEVILPSFLHPIKTLRQMPIECLLFMAMLVYCIAYMLQSSLFTQGVYMQHNHRALPELLKINSFELGINIIAAVLFLINLRKPGNWLLKGMVISGTLISFFVVFYFQVSGYPDYYKTWYLFFPVIFCTSYIFIFIPTKLRGLVIVVMLLCSIVANCSIYRKEDGRARHELAKFIVSYDNLPITLCFDKQNVVDEWKIESFNSALKYLCPDKKIKFRTNHNFRSWLASENDMFFIMENGDCEAGNWVIVNKRNNSESRKEKILYENQIYQVYKMQ